MTTTSWSEIQLDSGNIWHPLVYAHLRLPDLDPSGDNPTLEALATHLATYPDEWVATVVSSHSDGPLATTVSKLVPDATVATAPAMIQAAVEDIMERVHVPPPLRMVFMDKGALSYMKEYSEFAVIDAFISMGRSRGLHFVLLDDHPLALDPHS